MERVIASFFDRANSAVPTTIHGTTLVLPQEQRFTTLTEITNYVTAIRENPTLITALGRVPPVFIRHRKGISAAHYEPATNTIAIPTTQGWAMRELVVLHELTHHICYSKNPHHRLGHGKDFIHTYVTLIQIILGDQAHFLVRTCFIDAGLW